MRHTTTCQHPVHAQTSALPNGPAYGGDSPPYVHPERGQSVVVLLQGQTPPAQSWIRSHLQQSRHPQRQAAAAGRRRQTAHAAAAFAAMMSCPSAAAVVQVGCQCSACAGQQQQQAGPGAQCLPLRGPRHLYHRPEAAGSSGRHHRQLRQAGRCCAAGPAADAAPEETAALAAAGAAASPAAGPLLQTQCATRSPVGPSRPAGPAAVLLRRPAPCQQPGPCCWCRCCRRRQAWLCP
jgi:hypothetical protein